MRITDKKMEFDGTILVDGFDVSKTVCISFADSTLSIYQSPYSSYRKIYLNILDVEKLSQILEIEKVSLSYEERFPTDALGTFGKGPASAEGYTEVKNVKSANINLEKNDKQLSITIDILTFHGYSWYMAYNDPKEREDPSNISISFAVEADRVDEFLQMFNF